MSEVNAIETKQKLNVAMISVLQFVFSIMVILLHSNRVFYSDVFHFTQKSIFSRLAVPFFLICSAYFYKRSPHKKGYFKKAITQYIGWSILYIPLGYVYIASLALPVFVIPLAIIVGLCYSGFWYQLWYIPAFLFGIFFVNKLNQYMKMRMVFLISLILYLIGSVETYSSYLQGTLLHQIYEQYRVFFLTSRNGLFYVPIFICVGYLIAQEQEVGLFSKQFFKIKCLLALGCLVLESTIIYMNQGIDKNFMFSFIPVTGLLFIWAKYTSIWQEKQLRTLKQLSIYYFFIHPLFIEMAALFSEEMGQSLGIHEGWVVFIFTLVATHLTAYSILKTGVVERIKIKLRAVAIFIKKNARKHSQINT